MIVVGLCFVPSPQLATPAPTSTIEDRTTYASVTQESDREIQENENNNDASCDPECDFLSKCESGSCSVVAWKLALLVVGILVIFFSAVAIGCGADICACLEACFKIATIF